MIKPSVSTHRLIASITAAFGSVVDDFIHLVPKIPTRATDVPLPLLT